MATLFDMDIVQYQCTCGQWVSLSRLYFCRHCLALRCPGCVTHEVDCHYCPNCLENMPSAEARLKKNRCGNCFDCPSCQHALSTRATSLLDAAAGIASDESPAKEPPALGAPKKVYYLVCSFCRWTSREAGIPDQTVASGNWPELDNPFVQLLNNVQENFRQLAAVEKAERERKKYTKRRSQLAFATDKYGIQNILTKRRLGLGLSDKESDSGTKAPSVVIPSEEVDALPDFYFTEDVKLEKVTTIKQRHSHPESQPTTLDKIYPIRKQLMVKRSQRCKVCEHNLCKAEFNPSSIKFKIQLSALFHVPEVRLMKPIKMPKGKATEIFLTLANLTPNITHIVILPNIEAENAQFVKPDIPVCEFTLPVKDDTAEYDENLEARQREQFTDDKNVVVFRRSHKIGLKISATFDGDENSDIWLAFLLKYDYTNTLLQVTGEQKESETVWLQQKVKVNLNRNVVA